MGEFQILPPAVKNLLIINALFFAASFVFGMKGIELSDWLGLHFFQASSFHFWQPVTYMFMHANFGHLFFNMFALWMFGAAIENYWGTKKFLIFYFVAGIGAALCHYLVVFLQVHPSLTLMDAFLAHPSVDTFSQLSAADCINRDAITGDLPYLKTYPDGVMAYVPQVEALRDTYLNSFNIIGASGAVYGLLLAFGMLFPNSLIYLYFLIPIKAKWFVLIFGGIEVLYCITSTHDGVAHIAHLGGMVFGLLLILYWRRKNRNRDTQYEYFR